MPRCIGGQPIAHCWVSWSEQAGAVANLQLSAPDPEQEHLTFGIIFSLQGKELAWG